MNERLNVESNLSFVCFDIDHFLALTCKAYSFFCSYAACYLRVMVGKIIRV